MWHRDVVCGGQQSGLASQGHETAPRMRVSFEVVSRKGLESFGGSGQRRRRWHSMVVTLKGDAPTKACVCKEIQVWAEHLGTKEGRFTGHFAHNRGAEVGHGGSQ